MAIPTKFPDGIILWSCRTSGGDCYVASLLTMTVVSENKFVNFTKYIAFFLSKCYNI